jgi:hypothetical protein
VEVIVAVFLEISSGGAGMDFIERIFGIDPDGGSGATEVLIIGVIVTALMLARFYWTKRRAG